MELKAPWLKNYGTVPVNLTYPKLSVSEAVLSAAMKNKNKTALTYMNKSYTYKTFARKVEELSTALYNLGVRSGDKVLLCLPNCPQAVYAFYAVNRVGAVSAFVSPLSAEAELEFCIDKCKSKLIITLDTTYEKFLSVIGKTEEVTLIATCASDELNAAVRTAALLKPKQNLSRDKAIFWRDLFKPPLIGDNIFISPQREDDTAVVLFSGGTTGVPKAVELTNLNLNALAVQTAAMCGMDVEGARMLSVLPVFHGFGLGICIHTVLFFGGESILVPRFKSSSLAKTVRRHKPEYIAGVPTMLDTLFTEENFKHTDLSFLSGVFSGGDSLTTATEERLDIFLARHNAKATVRQGFGATECVAASCLMPVHTKRADSVGLPYPDTYYKIVKPDTVEQVPLGEMGEICIFGKTVMKGYLDDTGETQKVLKVHPDGYTWLHTGDMGYMDKDGFVYFKQRLKRVIVTNGYNVYPVQIEAAINTHPKVDTSCVVGIKDDKKIQVAAAFAVLKNKADETDETKQELMGYLKNMVSKQSMPKCLYFIDRLPKTKLGKIAYTELMKIAEEALH